MKHLGIKLGILILAGLMALPSYAHRDGDEWRGHRHHEYRHLEHRHHHDAYPGPYARPYARPGCWIEGGYDRAGYYRERQVCREARVVVPMLPPPAVVFQPPSVLIQPPGVYLR
jgi:hypothetical protein